jgi:hypothetical protein
VGLNLISVQLELKAQGTVVNGELTDESLDIPFPTAGVYFNWAFSDRLALATRFQYFGLEVGNVEGSTFLGTLRLEHMTFEHVSFGLGYDLVGLAADVKKKKNGLTRTGEFRDFSHGPRIGVTFRF